MTVRLSLTVLSMALLLSAGYFRLFEILVEWCLIGYFTFHLGVADPGYNKRSITVKSSWLQAGIDFLYSKREQVSDLLHKGNPGKSIGIIILGGLGFGWALALLWFLGRDYRFVVSREIIETAFDILIFIPVLYVFRDYYRKFLSDLEIAKEKDTAATREERKKEDKILQDPDPDQDDDFGQPVGAVGGFSAGTLKERVQGDYFIRRGLRGMSIFDTINDVREEEDEDNEKAWQSRLVQGFVGSGYSVVTGGALIFLLGALFSLANFVPITEQMSEWLFPTLNT